MAYAILRTQKLKGAAVAASDQHTERTRETINADAAKLQDNVRLIGKPDDKLRELVDRAINAAGGKPRKDSVECVEFLFAASPQFFDKPTKTIEFAEKTMEYIDILETRGFKFVKAVMHVDEKTPHVVAYAVPFDPDGKLNAKHHLGGSKWRMSEYQDEFAEVMQPLGLMRGIRGSNAEHQKIQKYYGKLDLYDQAMDDLDIARRNEEELRQTLEQNTVLLNRQLDSRSDIKLETVAKALIDTQMLQPTSQGLAILNQNDPQFFHFIITPDNKVFTADGDKISDGSSVMFLQQISQLTVPEVLTKIETSFGEDTKKCAARAYGEALANYSEDTRRMDFTPAAQEVKQIQKEITQRMEFKEARGMTMS